LVEVLDQRAGSAVSALDARPAAIWLVNVCEDRAEAAIGERKIFRIAFYPRDVAVACIRGTSPRDG